MSGFPPRVQDLARDRGFGGPVARYHTIRRLGVNKSGWLGALILLLGILLGSVLAAKINSWLFLTGPALMILLILFIPALRWYWQPAETRRRFYVYEKGLVYTSRDLAAAVPWDMVDEVIHRRKSSRSYGRTATTYYEVLQLALRPRPAAQPTGLLVDVRPVVDLWPVAHQRAMTENVRKLVGNAVRWTELKDESLIHPALADLSPQGGTRSAATPGMAPPVASADQSANTVALLRDALADAQADQAKRREAARASLAERLASYSAEDGADAEELAIADRDFASGQVQAAFDRILGLIQRKSGEERDRARLRLLELFDASPPQDQQVTSARAALSRLLFLPYVRYRLSVIDRPQRSAVWGIQLAGLR